VHEGNKTILKTGMLVLLHVVQTGSGAHPAFYPMGTWALTPGVKRQGHEADYSLPTSGEVKKKWVYISTPHTSS
jgi:hypothetical protein